MSRQLGAEVLPAGDEEVVRPPRRVQQERVSPVRPVVVDPHCHLPAPGLETQGPSGQVSDTVSGGFDTTSSDWDRDHPGAGQWQGETRGRRDRL